MSAWIPVVVALIAAAASVAAAYFALVKGRGENTVAAAAVEATKQATRIENDKRIDERIKAEMERTDARIEDLERDLEKLDTTAKAARKENETIRDVVGRWVRALNEWDRAGRRGRMPLPSREAMELLELDFTQYNDREAAAAAEHEPTL